MCAQVFRRDWCPQLELQNFFSEALLSSTGAQFLGIASPQDAACDANVFLGQVGVLRGTPLDKKLPDHCVFQIYCSY